MSRKTKAQQTETAQNIETLRAMIPAGTTVYTILRNVSSSGMSRNIDVYVMIDNEPRWISGYVRDILEMPEAKDGSIRVGGCGMDMGVSLVYGLSRRLFPDGFDCIGEHDNYYRDCPSNDHSNIRRDNPELPKHHSDGGYALKHRWM